MFASVCTDIVRDKLEHAITHLENLLATEILTRYHGLVHLYIEKLSDFSKRKEIIRFEKHGVLLQTRTNLLSERGLLFLSHVTKFKFPNKAAKGC